jgi:hypothetical protein
MAADREGEGEADSPRVGEVDGRASGREKLGDCGASGNRVAAESCMVMPRRGDRRGSTTAKRGRGEKKKMGMCGCG